MGKVVFFGKAVFRTPPEVVSSFGGGSSLACGADTCPRGGFINYFIPDPPPEVVRGFRGGGVHWLV